jgi:hypothetical protein
MWYGKSENVCEVKRPYRLEFAEKPLTRLTNARIRDKFETDGTCTRKEPEGLAPFFFEGIATGPVYLNMLQISI